MAAPLPDVCLRCQIRYLRYQMSLLGIGILFSIGGVPKEFSQSRFRRNLGQHSFAYGLEAGYTCQSKAQTSYHSPTTESKGHQPNLFRHKQCLSQYQSSE